MQPRYSAGKSKHGYQVIQESAAVSVRTVPFEEVVDMLNAMFDAACISDSGIELNMHNYNHDEVDQLNDSLVEIHALLNSNTKRS